jgi:hypothetical protein
MRRIIPAMVLLMISILCPVERARAGAMTFDRSQWMTGDMNEQTPADSAGTSSNSHVDHFYYYERIPMCLPIIDDSLAAGSSSRTYDSAVLALVVAASGLTGSDLMQIFGKRITRPWSENGVSWTYHHASPDSAWTASGGDMDNLPCMDTVLVDASAAAYDTLYFHLDTGFVRAMIEEVNFGWLMMAENIVDRATFQLFAEDATSEDRRPTLTVYYSDGDSEAVRSFRRRRMRGE